MMSFIAANRDRPPLFPVALPPHDKLGAALQAVYGDTYAGVTRRAGAKIGTAAERMVPRVSIGDGGYRRTKARYDD
jgi:hypothetical protein